MNRILLAYALVLIVLGLYGAYLWQGFLKRGAKRAVYMGSALHYLIPILKKIIEEHIGNQTGHYTFLELGAGHALVTRRMAKWYVWKNSIAVEISSLIASLAKINIFLSPYRSSVKVLRADLLNYKIENPAVLYCYINSSLLDILYKQGKLVDCLLISLSFTIPNCQPDYVYPMGNWQGNVYVYDFRNSTLKE